MIKFTDQKISGREFQLLINYFQENMCLKDLYIRKSHVLRKT